MLREYVTKRLPFLQPSGKRVKTPEKPGQAAAELEDRSGQDGEDLSLLFSQAPPPVEAEAVPGQPPEPPSPPAAPPAEPQGEPGQADFESGLAACRRGDYPEARESLLRAARQGHPGAQFQYGQLCRQSAAPGGQREALVWYKRAAKQGHIDAQLACAVMYEEGLGAEMDLKRALSWYEQAARQGSVGAQLKCGRLYAGGRAEIRNPKKARRWLETAAGNGSEEARKLLLQRF